MNEVVFNNRFRQFQRMPITGLLLLFLLLTACIGGGNDAAQDTAVSPETAASQSGSLVCTESCLSQGQCGTAADGRTVILAHGSQATARDHNMILPNESAVNIIGSETHAVVDAANNQSTLTFYLVQSAEGGPNNWVAESCVNISQ